MSGGEREEASWRGGEAAGDQREGGGGAEGGDGGAEGGAAAWAGGAAGMTAKVEERVVLGQGERLLAVVELLSKLDHTVSHL